MSRRLRSKIQRVCSPVGGLVLLCATSCSDGENTAGTHGANTDDGSGKPSLNATVGGLSVAFDEHAQLTISSNDRIIFAGLPTQAVKSGNTPNTGFAIRAADRSYEEQFGSFKILDKPIGPWRVASSVLTETAEPPSLLLRDDAGDALLRVTVLSQVDGQVAIAFDGLSPSEQRFSIGFSCDKNEHFVGFGSQSWDIDQRGQSVPIWVQENGIGKSTIDDYTLTNGADDPLWFLLGRRHSAQWAMPWTLSSRGVTLIAQTDGYSRFDLCRENENTARVELDLPFVFHVFDGPSPVESVRRATSVFGRPKVPPPLAFAPWNDAVHGPEEVMALADLLRANDIPSSVIWTEDWKGGAFDGGAYKLEEEWAVDTTLYPDLPGMIDELHTKGFAFFGYFNQFLYTDTKAYKEASPKGYAIKRADGSDYTLTGAKFTETSMLDLSNPGAREWAADKMRAFIDLGGDGWMHDYAEWLPTDSVNAGGSGLKLHNRYPILWQGVGRSVLDEANQKDGRQRLFFARSGWFGTPPLTDVWWAGDQRTSFDADDGLPSVITQGINLSVLGCPAFGHDISGYQSSTNDPATKELFWRWTQFGSFSPVMRTHHGYQDDKNWDLNSDDETRQMWRKYALNHIQLAPYLMAHATKAEQVDGVAIMRGLFLHYPDSDEAWTTRDEYMLGDAIFVAPVIKKGDTSRAVWFPPESRWYPFEGGAAVKPSASGTATVDAPLEKIPVFLRPGVVVPRYPDTIRTLAFESDEVPGPEKIGDDRALLVTLGGSYSIEESGGLSYELTGDKDSSGQASYLWNNAKLSACSATPKAPCVTEDSGMGAVVYVVGPGSLSVTTGSKKHSLKVSGGNAKRVLSIDVRR